MNIADATNLDLQSLDIEPRVLASALVYTQLFRLFSNTDFRMLNPVPVTEATNEFDNISAYFGDGTQAPSHCGSVDIAESTSLCHMVLEEFFQKAVFIDSIEDLCEALQFVGQYAEISKSYDLPLVCKYKPKAELESHYEEFLAYQTHHSQNLQYISSH